LLTLVIEELNDLEHILNCTWLLW